MPLFATELVLEPTLHGDSAMWLIALFTLQGVVIWLLSQRRYLVWKDGRLTPAFTELQESSSYLISGAVIAQMWVHGDPASYQATLHATLVAVPQLNLEFDLHLLANEVVMTFFFGIAAKELAEAFLKPRGALRGMKGVLPLVACLGGVVAPAVIYRILCTDELANGWAVPCATDIAFAWLGARMIWGPTHPAIHFLLALAIADDFIGMGVIAVFYPQRPFQGSGLLLLATGVVLAIACRWSGRRVAWLNNWQAFIFPGIVCWLGLFVAGLHPALALVFVVPFIPMKDDDQGLFVEAAGPHADDPINRFEQSHKPFVDMGLFYFGLANAGVVWVGTSVWDRNSWAVFLGLGVGKTLGISLFTVLGYFTLKLIVGQTHLPKNQQTGEQLTWIDVPLMGLLGAMGFTVALFVADAAGGYPSLKIGALASFFYLALAILLGRLRRQVATSRQQRVN